MHHWRYYIYIINNKCLHHHTMLSSCRARSCEKQTPPITYGTPLFFTLCHYLWYLNKKQIWPINAIQFIKYLSILISTQLLNKTSNPGPGCCTFSFCHRTSKRQLFSWSRKGVNLKSWMFNQQLNNFLLDKFVNDVLTPPDSWRFARFFRRPSNEPTKKLGSGN